MSKSILIVDDANTIRQLLSMTLRNVGYNVVEACDGRDGLTKLNGNSVNMIFTDLNMPVMNGIEFIKAVKSLPQFKFVPMVMLTTESEESKKREGQAAGAKAWIIKPFKPEQIVTVVKKIIG
jgi:two-component system chemotaxis response regulator CheY